MTAALDGSFWHIADAAAFVAAIDGELADRARSCAERVRKGAMHPREAEHVVGLLADMRVDLLHAFAPVPEGEPRGPLREDPVFTWTDKVTWIRKERDALEATIPELVRKGRMTIDDARRARRVLAVLHKLYWREMFMWRPPEGPAADYLRALRAEAVAGGIAYRGKTDLYWSDGAKLYRQMVRDHVALIEAENDDAQGRMVA